MAKTLTAAYDLARRLAHTPEAKRYAALEALRHTDWIPQPETLQLTGKEAQVIRLWRKAGGHTVVFDALLEALGPALWFQRERPPGGAATPTTSPTRRPISAAPDRTARPARAARAPAAPGARTRTT